MLLESALYTKFDSQHINGAIDPKGFEDWLSQEIAAHHQKITEHCNINVAHHFITSTVLTNSLNRKQPSWDTLGQAIQSQTGLAPIAYLNAYECTGWGYIFRLIQQLNITDKPILISILDANAFQLDCWKYHEQWGDSGFGLGTLLVRHSGDQGQLHISASTANNPFTQFAMTVRKELATDNTLCAAMPFFPAHTQALFDRILASLPHLQDHHPQWGHCFGSDPWLSIILSHCKGYDFNQYSSVLACSLAYSGYISLAKVQLANEGLFTLSPSLLEQA